MFNVHQIYTGSSVWTMNLTKHGLPIVFWTMNLTIVVWTMNLTKHGVTTIVVWTTNLTSVGCTMNLTKHGLIIVGWTKQLLIKRFGDWVVLEWRKFAASRFESQVNTLPNVTVSSTVVSSIGIP
jgi:hypothetical protein